METVVFFKTEITATDGTPVCLVYDREADILEIFFGQNEPVTGVELTDNILLRVNLQTRLAISITVLHLLNTMPVCQFLKLTHFQASPTEQTPVSFSCFVVPAGHGG